MSKRRKPKLEQVERSFVEKLAYILGSSSAAANALREAATREANGHECAFYLSGESLVVGPPPATNSVTAAEASGPTEPHKAPDCSTT